MSSNNKQFKKIQEDEIIITVKDVKTDNTPELELLKLKEIIYTKDDYSQNDAEEMILKEENWNFVKRSLSGEDAAEARRVNKSLYPISEIIKKYPGATGALIKRFDSAVSISNIKDPNYDNYSITTDYGCILPNDLKEKKENFLPEIGLLNKIIETEGLKEYRDELLKHPLICSFVELKWKKFTPFALLSLCFYIFLSVMMTIYVINIQLSTCRIKLDLRNMTEPGYTTRITYNNRTFSSMFSLLMNPPMLSKHNIKYNTACNGLETFYMLTIPIITIMILIIFVLEIIEIYSEGWNYLRPKSLSNYLQWIYIIFGTVTIFPVNLVHWRAVLYYQYQFAAFGILSIWSLLLIQASKFKSLAMYVDMLGEVILSFGKYILTFGCLFVGFTLSSLILFSNFPRTESVWRAALYTLTAMNGDFNYEENFYRDIRDLDIDRDNNKTVKNKHVLLYPFSSHLFLTIFTIIVTMALMNLLIALAVRDVTSLEETVGPRMLRRMIKEIHQTEKVVYTLSLFLPNRLQYFLKRQLSLNHTIIQKENSIQKNLIETKVEIFPNARKWRDEFCKSTVLKYIKIYITNKMEEHKAVK